MQVHIVTHMWHDDIMFGLIPMNIVTHMWHDDIMFVLIPMNVTFVYKTNVPSQVEISFK